MEAVIFFMAMGIVSGLMLYLYRALGDGQISVDSQGMKIEMRALVRTSIPLETIQAVQKFARFPAVHVGFSFGGSLDMVTGLGPGVALDLNRPCRGSVLGFPLSVKKVHVSVDDADFFLSYLNSLREKKI